MSAERKDVLEPLLVTLRRRWRIVALCVVLATAAGLLFSKLETRKYTAAASLLFRTTALDQQLFGYSAYVPNADPTQQSATNAALVTLPVIDSRTAAALHLSAPYVHSAVSASEVGQASVVQVQATDPSPVEATRIANTYAQEYVAFSEQADQAAVLSAKRHVQSELQALDPQQRSGPAGQTLRNRAAQLTALAALQGANAQIVQQATVPNSPSGPNTKRNGLMGLLLGLLLGVGLAFLAERFDRRIRESSELGDAYGVGVIATVPIKPEVAAATEQLPGSVGADAFRSLRARLRYFNPDEELHSLGIVSALPGEGKTTIAMNLAMAEAATRALKVVLVEADLRSPMLAQRLGIHATPGVADILSRKTTLDAAVQTMEVPQLDHDRDGKVATFDVLTAGALPPNPTELLESRAMIDLLSALGEQYDLVILDTPAMSSIPDAIPLMQLVSGVLIVGRMDVTTREAANEVREQLDKLGAPTLGVVANASEPIKPYQYGPYSYDSRARTRRAVV